MTPDGSVPVPPHLAGPVRDLLITGLWDLARVNGGTVHPDLHALIEQLHRADQRRDQVPPPPSSANGTASPPPATVEIAVDAMAEVMGCSREFVRRLARAGKLPARRIGRIWLITIEEERTHAHRS